MCVCCLTVLGPIIIFSNQPTHRCIDGARSGSIYQTDLLHVIATRMHMMRPAGDSRHMHVIYYTCIWHAYCNMTGLLHSNYFILFSPLFFFFYFLLHLLIFFFRQAWTLIVHIILFCFSLHALLFFFFIFLYKFYFLI